MSGGTRFVKTADEAALPRLVAEADGPRLDQLGDLGKLLSLAVLADGGAF